MKNMQLTDDEKQVLEKLKDSPIHWDDVQGAEFNILNDLELNGFAMFDFTNKRWIYNEGLAIQ